MITIKEYSSEIHDNWNEFVKDSRNGTFIHLREYMEYHKDRFSDMSLVAYSGNKIVAVLPANVAEHTLYSHQGLTYGGWLINRKDVEAVMMLEIFDRMASCLKEKGINRIIYKTIPHIYHSYPSEEDIYALFRHNAILTVSNISTTLPLNNPIKFNESSRRSVRLASAAGITAGESEELEEFWDILTQNLNARYNAAPVHTIDEIKYLKTLFPDNIKLFTAGRQGKILGGVLVYDTGIVVHAQYTSASPEGKKNRVLPLVFHHLINERFRDRKYFDFGTSNENEGQYLNEGLSMQKTCMGGRGIVYNTYQILI